MARFFFQAQKLIDIGICGLRGIFSLTFILFLESCMLQTRRYNDVSLQRNKKYLSALLFSVEHENCRHSNYRRMHGQGSESMVDAILIESKTLFRNNVKITFLVLRSIIGMATFDKFQQRREVHTTPQHVQPFLLV